MPIFTGTPGNDTIIGTKEDDDIRTGGGNDRVEGRGGNDLIFGEGGDDILEGGDGNDILVGEGGDDTLIGGEGDDRLLMGNGNDTGIGGAGNDDYYVENSGFDGPVTLTVDAGTGDDIVRYNVRPSSPSTVDLGAGNDQLYLTLDGNGGRFTMGSGTDLVQFSSLRTADSGEFVFTDFATGNTGDQIDLSRLMQFSFLNYDRFSNPFGTGHVRLTASGADTLLTFYPHPDFAPTFTVRFLNTAPSAFTAHNFSGINPNGVSTNGPPITGTAGNDTLDGTGLGETISGFAGNDVINAGGGDDTLVGGTGDDTLNGGDGDDLFISDLSSGQDEDPRRDTINGGAGTDTLRVIGSSQGFQITEYNLAGDLPITSIEGLHLSGNLGLIGTVAQVNAFSTLITPNLRITDNALLDPTGRFEVTQLSLPNGGARANLSGPGVFVLNIVSGDGDDNIVGPDGGIANPTPNQTDIEVGIDVRGGNDTVVAGNIRTRILSSGGNNNFTGSTFADTFYLTGDGNNTIIAGDGNDSISVRDRGRLDIRGGAGNDTIQVQFLDADDSISGGDGVDRLVVDTGDGFGDVNLTGVTIPGDIEIIAAVGERDVIMTVAQLRSAQQLELRYLTLADGGAITLTAAPLRIRLSSQGNSVDLGAVTSNVQVVGNGGRDTIIGGAGFDVLNGGAGDDSLYGNDGWDSLYGGDGVDLLSGGTGENLLEGGSNVDTAVVSGTFAQYTITQQDVGEFIVTGPGGANLLRGVEFLQFDDQTIRLRPGTGVSVTFETADPSVYQDAMSAIRDFDGNLLGGNGAWLRIGSADVNGDGDIDQILVNDAIGRFATVGTAPDGLVYFRDHGWAGETRVAGIYIDPLVAAGIVQAGSDQDSQRRFQNDLQIENINRVLGANDYDRDGIQEVYFALTDGTAYLRALMHADGNIRYANYQSQQQVIDYLTANGFGPETWAGWFPAPGSGPSSAEAQEAPGRGRAALADLLGVENAALPGEVGAGRDALHFLHGDAMVAEYYG